MSTQEISRFPEQATAQTISQRFSQQVARCPDAGAVKTRSRSISYRELDELSNQLANAVLHHSRGTSTTVVTLFEQGVESIIAILGVLKAGKIYVSLDPSAPPAELRRIIADCDPELVLSTGNHRCRWEGLELALPEIFLLDQAADFSSRQPEANQLSPDSPAYIFYTSGSTGSPKGVVDSHGNVLHNVLRYTNNLEIDGNDKLSMIQACNFSGTVSSLFSALLNGATICPFDLAGEGIDALADFIIHEQVTIFHSVPTIFENMMLSGRDFPALRVVRLEGDRTEPRHIELFNRVFEDKCQLAIGLGATETGLTRQYLLAHKADFPEAGSPIGFAVDGMDVTLVDESGEAVKPGDPGEIQVSSSYLALGYWQQPELTEERFVYCSDNPRIRKYRTGDMARMLPDGCLMYLGRKDFRTKIRGISIETVDIELVLQSHTHIEHALVQIFETRPGVQQLAAYLVLAKDATPTVCEIREYLSKQLPAYMIPARYEFLDMLPVDRNGKISRSKLPALHTQRPSLQQAYQPATTQQQKILVQCFEDILSLENIGVRDNFYDIGGDSLLLMQLLIIVEEKTGLTFPEGRFFESPDIVTIEKLLEKKPTRASIVDLQPLGDRLPLFCLHTQLGIEVEYRNLAQLLGPDIPVVGVQAANIPGHIEATSIESLATEYLVQIREKQASGPYYLCGTCFSGLLAFELAQQLVRQGEVVAFLGLIDTEYPRETLVAALRRVQQSNSPLAAIGRMMYSKGRALFGSDDLKKDSANQQLDSDPDTLHDLTSTRTGTVLNNAGLKYRPKAYPGAVTLFYTGTIDNRYGWHRLARGGYSAIQLPMGPEEELPHLTSPPFVSDLAREIHNLLVEAVNKDSAPNGTYRSEKKRPP